jgi:hypothetical protein
MECNMPTTLHYILAWLLPDVAKRQFIPRDLFVPESLESFKI